MAAWVISGRAGGRRARPRAMHLHPIPTTMSIGVRMPVRRNPRFRVRPSAGPQTGREFTVTAQQYCEEIARSEARLKEITGQAPLPLFRAPGGKTSARLLQAAKRCGYAHVGWSPAGFLGDELPSERYSNAALLQQALERIRPGDILLAHLGIWSRKDPWAPAVLEPLIEGLKSRGFCFRTLRDHPEYQGWIAAHPVR